ncbi:MAG: DEAD/DEAH box helicase family protein [Clostridia bacterium]|nr:DEAD/DEAH box helicase family protein [Clostridia bacterium]
MSDTKRLSERNAAIQAMLSSAEGIKDFYRFTAQNPHISLHDACQIVIQRPKASVCYSFAEWNNKRRYINRGSKGIAYYDSNGNKCHVFDARDTHAEQAFTRESEPIGKVLQEMDALNGTELFSDMPRDYAALCDGVAYWLHENGYLQDNAEENTLLTEGVSYSLWCSTDAAQEDDEIQMHGLPYDLQDNADFCKNVYMLTAVLQREAAEAYVAVLSLPKEVDDTDEETVSDEPEFSAVPQEAQKEEKPQISEPYKAYLSAQEKYPQAVVVQRLGDFYEIMGENATTIGNELDVTVTSRRVGLPERVPMVGFPYHAADKYIEKMLERHSVVVLEEKQEPKYILSHAESLLQNDERENQKSAEQAPTYAEENEDYIEDEEYYADEFSDEESDDDVYYDYTEEDEESNGVDAEYEDEEERPKADNTPSNGVSKPKKGIQDRKRKESPQLSFFTTLEPVQEKSRKEEMIERQLKRGSSFEHGKYRIMDMYRKNPTTKEFANLLKNEYGIGGYGSWGGDNQDHDSRGIEMKLRGEKGEVLEQATLKWTEVAERIADIIEANDYLTPLEEEEYKVICARREERKNAKSDEEKIQVIARQAIEIGTQNTRTGKYEIQPHMFEESAQFCRDRKAELTAALLQAQEVKEIYPTEFPYQDNISVEFYPQYCVRLQEGEERVGEATQEEQIEPPIAKNTDLNEIGFDQSELGGAKTRYKGNVAAIRLVEHLERAERAPTQEEKKTLATYVGWGGIAQVFDANNEQWRNEYNELKDLLSPKDYENAKGSVLNAHFTDKAVIDGIYAALKRLDVGRDSQKIKILEPAMGTGNFFGFMPQEIADNAKLYGVELDNITGRIAKQLYPQADIQIKGFEDTTFSDSSFDVVVGNVPFGSYSVYDKDYARQSMYIHDYFIAKSVDKLKPGGIVAVVTSSGTLDKQNTTARKYIADRAELIGAIRLPNTAFKQTANTEVVADILLLQKRVIPINATEENIPWLATQKIEHGTSINSYFVNHPEMVLGDFAFEMGMYGAPNMTVKPDGRELSDALNTAVQNLPQNIFFSATTEEEDSQNEKNQDEKIEVDYHVKSLCYKAENGKLYMRVGDRMEEQEIPKSPKDAYYRIKEMIALREELHRILDIQSEGCSNEELTRAQWRLNARYDTFVERYGILNSKTNSKLFKDDGDSALLFACENLSEDKKSATKADVFRKRTIQPYTVPTSTDDCMEALQISKNERGKVDIAYIQELTQKDFDTVLAELGNAVFRNPATMRPEDKYSGYESADEYLSGDVVTKLQLAKLGADQFPNFGFERNVAALTESQPQKLTASEISVRISASWVDADYYKQFLCELLDIRSYYAEGLRLFRNPFDSSWRVDTTATLRAATEMKATEVYGTKRASAFRLFEDALNLRDTTIYDTIQENGKDKQVVNQAETIAAREKQNQIREEFKSWIFADPARREHLERIYNATFNRIKLPTYDGSYLRFPGMNPAIELRPHQKNAVHRIVTDGNALLHHVVGSGKTYTICAAIMKLKQYGLAKKPMIAVPNHLVGQWASELRKLYPKANILVAEKEDLEKENRKKFVSKVAMGDWDAVIIAQSSFAKINVSKERQIRKVQEEIANVERSIQAQKEDKNASRGSIKNLEQIKKNREAQLKELTDDTKKDNVLIFEDLGVDYLFVDEAHYYKNLFLFTKMNNVAGISKAASKRASDLQMKCEYINELHGGDKGVVFATGTPISNSMTEMYTMQKYLQPSELKDMGIEFFDGWAADFGETVTALEMAPSGKGYRPRTRFCKFTNLPELMKHYRRFADVQTADMVKLNVPDAEHITVTLKPSDTTIELAEEIADRAQRIYDGGVNSSVDNMLKVTSDGKKLALDPRCFVPTSADEEGSKINACALRVYEIWKDTQEKKCTQLVFCDMSTPKKTFDDYVYGEDFDAYNELKYKLVQMGIPKEEIAFIHDANSDKSKQALFDSVNSGKVRVLIGSTEKCGAGTNVQKRLIALHHLDTPYRPSDLNQREGRIIRQGNENKAVKIFTYVTERTFDSYSYQILENKQRFISQIDRGDLTVREAEDIDETTLSYAEIKAITAANPRIKQKMEVDAEVSRLRVLEGQYRKNLYALQDKVRKEFPSEIQRCEQKMQRAQEDLLTIKACRPEDADQFSILVCGKRYTDKKEGGKALMDALFESKPGTVVAEYCGLKIALELVHIFGGERSISLSGTGQYSMNIGESTSGNLTRLDNFLDDFPALIERAKQRKAQLQADLKVAEEQVQKPFEHKDRLDALLCEQSELNTELDIGQKQEIVVADETQEEEPQATLDSDDDLYMALPPKGSARSTHRRVQQRKPVDGYLLRTYNKEQKETPDAYVFVHNGNSYDLIGEQAEKFAKENNLPISTEQYNGKKLAVVSLPFAALDERLVKLTQAGKQVKIIEEIEQKREEEDMIDREDKTAQMQVPVLPDYTIGQDDMHDAGYTWDGMLPLRKRMAKLLVKLGLPVVVLKGDDTDKKITTIDEVEQGGNLFGIEKPDWNEFIASDKGRAYLSARLLLCQSMKHLTIEEMSYFDAQFVDGLIDSNYAERVALEKCLRETEKPETGAIKSYIQELLEDYTARFGNLPLKEYGWELYNVRNYLAEFIPNEEISKYAQELVNEQRLHNEIDWKLKQIVWLNGKTEGFDKEVISDIVNDLKPSFEYSFFNKSGKDDYDEWYDEFAEEKLTPYLESKAAESSSEDMRLEQRVKASVEAEYKAFYAEESKKTPEELISTDNYKIRFFNELSVFLGEDIEDNLYDRDLQALLEDSPHILDNLYDYFLGSEYASINNYADVKELIEAYNDKYHEEIVADRYSWNEGDFDSKVMYYYGKDTSNTAYYYLPSLSYDTLPEIKEKADSYVVAAPVSYLSDEIKEKYNIFFLKTDRDIAESELKDNAAAIGNMQSAVHRVVKARREEYYTVKKDTVNGKVEYTPVYLDANTGEIGTLFRRSFDTKKEIDELIAKVNTATDVPRDYVLVYVTPEELARRSEEIKKYTTAQTLQGEFLDETKDGYKVVNITKDKDERNIAIIYRQTANDFILAPRYDTSDGTWAQSYYYNSLESAEQDRAKMYGDKPKIYENKEWDKMPETKQQAEENMEQKKQAAKLKATVSRSAVIRLYNDRVFMRMPNTVEKYRSCTYNLRNHQFVMSKDEGGNEVVKISLPEDFYVRLNDAKGGKAEISAAEFTALVGGTTEEDYARVADNGWHYASVPATGKIMALENSMLFRMPKGEYERYAYTIPSPFIRYNEERDSYAIGIPEDFTVSMKDNKSNDTVTMTAESFIAEIKGKTESDYESTCRRPSEESKKRFAAVEERLRQSVPEEMKTRPNWVVVRTQENEEKGRADTFMIDVHTGKRAQPDDPNTWTDLDAACEYARENGGVALGYALDGNDQVSCIDIDKCFAENGDMTPLAAEVFKKGNGTYAEKSVSGNSLHVFGKTDGMNLRAFGKDGDLAFYRKSHFVAMTGDNYGSSELKSLDTPDMKALLERKCEKRKEWNGVGKGVEGLSAMGDRDVVEKACSAAKGDVFVALYRGEDLQNNRNSSDISFMKRLAFWCNGDKEQMLRIFATSGLYRADKPLDYYENAAIKAVQDTVDRYHPKDKPTTGKPSGNKPSGNGSGKR